MANPDGVFLGNYRSTLVGFDLNRSYHVATPWAHPTIRAIIDLFVSIDKSKVYLLSKKIIVYKIYKLYCLGFPFRFYIGHTCKSDVNWLLHLRQHL